MVLNKIIKVEGMHCAACEKLVKMALEDEGFKVVDISHETGAILIEESENIEKAKKIIEDEGYKVLE